MRRLASGESVTQCNEVGGDGIKGPNYGKEAYLGTSSGAIGY